MKVDDNMILLRAGTSRWKGTRGEERRRKKIMAVLSTLSGEE